MTDRPGKPSKAADARTADARTADAPTADARAADARTADTRTADTRAADARAADARTADARAADARTADARTMGRGPTNDWWDQAGEWIAAHGALPALAIITLAVAIIHAGVFLGEVAGDDLSFHFAESARLADCLRVGDFDFWNPSANAGYASGYYYQVVPQLVSAIPTAIFGHHLFWFQLSVALPLVLAPAAAYRGMRLLGATPWQAVIAAFAVGFMNGESRWGSGNAGTFQVGLYTQTWALAAFPIALGHGARWISDAKGLPAAIAWGAFVGLCHPFAVIVLGVALALGVIARALPSLDAVRWPSVAGRAAVMAGIVILWLVPHTWSIYEALPPAVIWLLGGLLIVGGLALPIVRRVPDAHWNRPELPSLLRETKRMLLLGGLMILAWMPVWLPLLIDYNGFGGFPHRVSDEIGPGFLGLGEWYRKGALLDWSTTGRIAVMTWSLPIVLLFVRAPLLRWLWPSALFYALLLALGPHMGKIGDDLFPPVRALGAMQIVLALGLGVGALLIGRKLWDAPWDDLLARWRPMQPRRTTSETSSTLYAARTVIAAIAAALVVLVAVPGARALAGRVRTFGGMPSSNRDEMLEVNEILAKQPPGRKQVGPGAENHWWNLLSYVYVRVPSLLQMGGGGLQASPNYDFLWTQRDLVKDAWIYDAPYLVFMRSLGSKMPNGDTIARTKSFEIRKLPSPGLVSPVQVTGVLPPGYHSGQPGHKAALDWIKSDAPMKDQVLAYEGSGGPGDPPDAKTLKAWHQDSPGDDADIVAEVDAAKPSTFVVRESWHPRWRAYIDGDEVAVRRVTPDFPAVDVAAGKHTIELRFERPWWAQAAWLAWPGVPLLAWLVMRRRRKPPPLPKARALAET